MISEVTGIGYLLAGLLSVPLTTAWGRSEDAAVDLVARCAQAPGPSEGRGLVRTERARGRDEPPNPREIAGRVWLWDSAGRPSGVDPAPSTPADSAASAPDVRWELASAGATKITLTVAVQPVRSGVLALSVTPSAPAEVTAVGICVPARPDEHLFGLGARFGPLNLVGQVVENWIDERGAAHGARRSHSPTPFLLSSRGYGLLLDTSARVVFDLRTHVCACYALRVEEPRLRAYLISGPDPLAILERHAGLVGVPPLPPRWAFGVWKNLIGGQARVERDLQRLRQDDVPLDAVWIHGSVLILDLLLGRLRFLSGHQGRRGRHQPQ